MKKARRVLLKVSGEWFSGAYEKGFDEKTFESLAKTLIEAKRKNIQIALVLGGGNIYRGRELASLKIDQVSADYIGMLSTIMNGIALSNFLSSNECANNLYSSFAI
ncbi:MAG: UMP kinase, partial [Pseudomonadota bacterium]|nr:UMP kinase [Pseudomonadota bacterium]